MLAAALTVAVIDVPPFTVMFEAATPLEGPPIVIVAPVTNPVPVKVIAPAAPTVVVGAERGERERRLGTTVLEAAEASPVWILFVAVTLKVYLSPLVSPVTVIGLADPDVLCPPWAGVVSSVVVTV